MHILLEKYLWDNFGLIKGQFPFARDIINQMVEYKMISNHKQAWRTLEKWSHKGLYSWGCSMDLGWKCTPEELRAFNETRSVEDEK